MMNEDPNNVGADGEDLSHLLRSLPLQHAPTDLEPKVMQRVGIARRRRGILGALQHAARRDWALGLVVAAVAGVLFAAASQVVQNTLGDRSTQRPLKANTTLRAVPSSERQFDSDHVRMVVKRSESRVISDSLGSVLATTPASHIMRPGIRRSVASTAYPHRNPGAHGITSDETARTLDTVDAIRLRPRPPVSLSSQRTVTSSDIADRPALQSRPKDESTGKDIGER